MFTQEVANLIPSDFSDHSKVWIFQCNRAFNEKEQAEVNEQLMQFYTQWVSHDERVKGWANLLFGQFIIVMADEAQSTQLGGCSTDGMMRLMKNLEKQYNVNLFDRMTLTLLVKGKAEMLPYEQVQYAIDKGFINEDTLMFNNIATTKKEILESWLVPLKYSWLASRVQLPMVNN